MADVSVVVVTYDAMPYIEQCLASVRGHETVVVDHGSTDGTLEVVRACSPGVMLVEQENRGLAAGWNTGLRHVSGRYVLLLNADAWVLGDAVEALAKFADANPRAGIVGPLLRYPDGQLQPSVRGFPTLWRLATAQFALSKLAPRSRTLNADYAGGFAHDRVCEAEWLVGACLLVRRTAAGEVGPLDEEVFLFYEETDWCYRFRNAGWKIYFYPGAEVTHVLGASHRGNFYEEQLRGHLRFFAKHRGQRQADIARRLMLAAAWTRGLVLRDSRGRRHREAARMLSSGTVATLLRR